MAAWAAWLAFVIVVVPSEARANIGLPMVFPSILGMVLGFVPVVLIEAYVLSRVLNLRFPVVIGPVARANFASTFLGIPLAWLPLVVLEIATHGVRFLDVHDLPHKLLAVVWQAPWLPPYRPELPWMVPGALLVLMPPFFLASWFVESRVLRGQLPQALRPRVSGAAFRANLASYALLVALLIAWMVRTAAVE